MQISITRTTSPKAKISADRLGFGKIFSDHMFMMEIENGEKQNPRIVPFGPLSLSPAATVLHYGQEIFEGLKAYKTMDGTVQLFRVRDNAERMEEGAQRLCLHSPGADAFVQAVIELVSLERDWVPNEKGTSLYIRPNLFGIDNKLGVDAAHKVLFNIICSPSGAYYSTGLAPVKIYVESNYVRAVRGGMGYTKTGGNYAASLIAGVKAHESGYNQVLWLDGV